MESKYFKYYYNLMAKAKNRASTRNQAKKILGYVELHHIIPKCLGGTNDKNNLVYLSGREHFVAHQFLIKMYPSEYKLVCAVTKMAKLSKTGKAYEWHRKLHSENMKGDRNPLYNSNRYGNLNPMFGKKHTEESKEKIREYSYNRSEEHRKKLKENHADFSGDKNPMFGKKTIPWNKGKTGVYSEETLQKLRSWERTEEIKEKMRKPKSKEHIEKLKGPQEKVQCPVCGKIGGKSSMKASHFDNCNSRKMNPENIKILIKLKEEKMSNKEIQKYFLEVLGVEIACSTVSTTYRRNKTIS